MPRVDTPDRENGTQWQDHGHRPKAHGGFEWHMLSTEKSISQMCPGSTSSVTSSVRASSLSRNSGYDTISSVITSDGRYSSSFSG
jgi:hypothetical protein